MEEFKETNKINYIFSVDDFPEKTKRFKLTESQCRFLQFLTTNHLLRDDVHFKYDDFTTIDM